MEPRKVLLTGGLGYIGSHTAIALHNAGYTPIIIDNLSNSSLDVLANIEKICGQTPNFEQGDCADDAFIANVFRAHAPFAAAIHFAALKAVGESVKKPLEYYKNNLDSLLQILNAMGSQCPRLVFSSSASVYGQPTHLPVTELTPLQPPTSPYGATKVFAERIIEDTIAANPSLSAISLRYFNPIGAHPSGLIGELPQGEPQNLLPYITQTAKGIRKQLTIFGNDYNTPDGTPLRDYFHVMDLARAHVLAVRALEQRSPSSPRIDVINVGSGAPRSVLDIVTSFQNATGVAVPHSFGPRRSGDAEKVWADISKAKSVLGWQPQLSLSDALRDAWLWEQSRSR